MMAAMGMAGLMRYAKDRAKETIRRAIPAHVRFVRAGEAFLADGEREVHLLHRLVEAGTTAIDVGAHIGDYTYSLCRHVAPGGRVISIEPIPELARMLQRATRHLQLPVTVVNCALSAKEGEAELFIPIEAGRRKTGFATLEPRGNGGKSYRVPLRRLDEVCKDVTGRISFIKIDVEGHELSVLQGGTETLRRHRPNLLIEIEQRHSSIPIGQTLDWLAAAGYRGEYLSPDGTPRALAEFDVEEHQTSRLDRVGTGEYVSNFLFFAND
jgi:FkbM family methyltransferase